MFTRPVLLDSIFISEMKKRRTFYLFIFYYWNSIFFHLFTLLYFLFLIRSIKFRNIFIFLSLEILSLENIRDSK